MLRSGEHEHRHFPDFKAHLRLNEYQHDVMVEQLKNNGKSKSVISRKLKVRSV